LVDCLRRWVSAFGVGFLPAALIAFGVVGWLPSALSVVGRAA
jgi:hypothetical protein